MRNLIILITFILILMLPSCSQTKEEESITTFEINPENITNAGFSKFYKLEKLIKLENNAESYFGDARKIIVTNDKIYIHPWGKPMVTIFDITGKYIGKIDNFGRGPGEYTYVVDISVLGQGDTICLYEKFLKQFMYYDLHGNFLKSIKTDIDLESFSVLPNGNIVGYSFLNVVPEFHGTRYQLWLIGPDGDFIKGLLPVKLENLGNSVGLSSTFHNNNEGLFFMPFTENMVYEIDQDSFKLSPKYYLYLFDKTIPDDLLNMPRKEMNNALFNESLIPNNEIIGNKYIFVKFYSYETPHELTAIIEKKNNSYILFDLGSVNDTENEINLQIVQQYIDGPSGNLIALIQPNSLSQYDYMDHDSFGYQLSEELNDTDNPVIAIYSER